MPPAVLFFFKVAFAAISFFFLFFFFKFYVFERERMHALVSWGRGRGEGDRESSADSPLSMETAIRVQSTDSLMNVGQGLFFFCLFQADCTLLL